MSTQIAGKQKIALKSAHGKFLVAEQDGTLNASRDAIGAWEQFTILKAQNVEEGSAINFGDSIALRSAHGKYVVAESDGNANANRDAIGGWEQWKVAHPGDANAKGTVTSDGKVALLSAHGKYLVAEADGSANANRDAVGAWETWRLSLPEATTQPPVEVETEQPVTRSTTNVPADDDSAKPAKTIEETGAATRAWNNYGGLVEKLAKENGIQTATVLAILAIESGGAGFVEGRLKIRFENHLFRRSMKKASRLAEYNANFQGGLKWDDGHKYLKDGKWGSVHKGQDNEWNAFKLAQSLDPELAAQSISMGGSQIVGFHAKRLGYGTAVKMLEAFQKSGAEHIRAMFNFLKTAGLVDAMRENDFAEVARVYNGSDNVPTYSKLMQGAYNAAKPKLDAIGVT